MLTNTYIANLLLILLMRKLEQNGAVALMFASTVRMKTKLTFTEQNQLRKFLELHQNLDMELKQLLICLYYFYALNPVIYKSAGITVERLDPSVVTEYDQDEYKAIYTSFISKIGVISESPEPSPRFVASLLLGELENDQPSSEALSEPDHSK